MPAGLKANQIWPLVKVSRSANRQSTALIDVRGKAFTYWLPPRAMEALHVVDRQGGGTLAVDDGISLVGIKDQVLVSSLMEEAIATSQIEGAVTTRQVAKAMLRMNRRPRDRSEQMIVNSFNTMKLLRASKDRPLTLDLLFEIQTSMTKDTLEDPSGEGRLRLDADEVRVVDVRDDRVIFTPPPARDLRPRLDKLIAFANAPSSTREFVHPLIKASIVHFWLAYEHPFVDGNGRTARALFYWYMLKHGYWLFEFLTVSRVINNRRRRYYDSFLFSENDDADLTYSIMFQVAATRQAVSDLAAYLKRKQAEHRAALSTLRAFPDLGFRQRQLLDRLMTNPNELVTFQSHQATHGITYVTARADLLDLVARGLLEEIKHGRQRAFLAPERLAERLQSEQKQER